MKYLTIDGGTTNTRIFLVSDGEITDCIKKNIGASKGLGHREDFYSALRNAISEILNRNNIQSFEINKIIASGMITSEGGICSLEHLTVPVGIKELHDNIAIMSIPEISDIDFAFIRGVKINGENFEKSDMMRGEETELFGLEEKLQAESAYILPGSHSKCIITDKKGRIVDFSTFMTGEMFAALMENTILKGSVDICDEFNWEYLCKGYLLCEENGVNAALFKTRILDKMYHSDKNAVYSFFEGVILHDEVKKIISLPVKRIILGGKKQIRIPMYYLIKKYSDIQVICMENSVCEISVPKGAIRIFENV